MLSENGLAEVEKGDSKDDTLAHDDDAHGTDVCTWSHVFCGGGSCWVEGWLIKGRGLVFGTFKGFQSLV